MDARSAIELDSSMAWELSEKELYTLLDSEIVDSPLGQLSNQIKKVHLEEVHNVAVLESKFDKAWNKIKDIACQVYSSEEKLEGKDLVIIIVTTIAKALGFTALWVVLTVTIAVKLSLNRFCQK